MFPIIVAGKCSSVDPMQLSRARSSDIFERLGKWRVHVTPGEGIVRCKQSELLVDKPKYCGYFIAKSWETACLPLGNSRYSPEGLISGASSHNRL